MEDVDVRDRADDDARAQRLVSVMLREGAGVWIAAGAAGGAELPIAAEPFKLRVALPVALGRALGLPAREAADLGAQAESHQEGVLGLRWLRWSVELPAGSFAALALGEEKGQAAMARAFESAVGVPLFARFEVPGLGGRDAKGDWASASRDPGDLLALFASLEAKAIGRLAPARGKGPGASRI